MPIPMLDLKTEYLYMKDDIDAVLFRCLDHQRWILGPEVNEFEKKIASYLNVPDCIGCSSGTEALVLALRALAIKLTGKEYFERKHLILTTPFTFIATGDAILRSGATPIFVDIDSNTYNVDISQLKACVEKIPDIIGIIPVHLYGRPCAMDEIMDLAAAKKLFVVEDVAQAFGASDKGRKLGAIGDFGCFSFFPSKNLGGFGDAGMVAAKDNQLAELVRMLTKHGGKDKNNADHIGYNSRLDTLQAAILTAKFKYVDEFNARRRKIALLYNEGLKGAAGIKTPEIIDGHVVHQYTICAPCRDQMQSELKKSGIQSMIYYQHPLHTMKVFKDNNARIFGSLANAESAALQVLSLPIDPLMNKAAIDEVVGVIKKQVTKG
ncbi:MAG: DegT/DnrJ/EryC1/StrS family aminotransferase [Candidatus Omnitrophota bacterium]|jgi:dTDP-4-amino-4,6-dideoxygalactose transaminase